MMNKTNEGIKNKVKEVIKLRKTLQQAIIDSGMSISPIYDAPNPFYNQLTEDSPIGAEYYYGVISKLYSPIGEFRMWSGACGNGKQHKALDERVKEMGFTMICEASESSFGVSGPWFAYGPYDDVTTYRGLHISPDECKRIYNECLEELKAEGFALEI